MSEMKPEVEYVIKTGRQVVDKRQVDFPDKLNAQIDGIKQQYNELGQQVRLTSRLRGKLDFCRSDVASTIFCRSTCACCIVSYFIATCSCIGVDRYIV